MFNFKYYFLTFFSLAPIIVSSSQEVVLTKVIDGLNSPVDITHAGDDRLFIVEQEGLIRIWKNNTLSTFLDIRFLVTDQENEQGLLGLSFHPDYANTGFFYINYTNTSGNTVIARYTVSSDVHIANASSAKIILTVDQPFPNHNGGGLAFGPDGYLYIGLGDGGAGGDPMDNGQRPGTMLGKLLRIDVDGGDPYAIPPTNPFVNDISTLDEIWALGLRNPWRFSFDRFNGDLFIADVGQNEFEEINRQAGLSFGGQNYGWRCFEGFESFIPTYCNGTYELPIYVYNHSLGCSITGGYVYRGEKIPSLQGKYIYGDFCTGTIWTLSKNNSAWVSDDLLQGNNISTFGEDASGEIYYADLLAGEIFRIDNLVTSVTIVEPSDIKFSINPNPTKDYLGVNIGELFSGRYDIYNALGSLEGTGNISHLGITTIDIKDLDSGIYYLRLYSDSKKAIKKFVIID